MLLRAHTTISLLNCLRNALTANQTLLSLPCRYHPHSQWQQTVQTVRPKMKWKRYSGAECPLTNWTNIFHHSAARLHQARTSSWKTQIRYGSEMKKTGLPLKRTFCRKMRIISVRRYTSVHLTMQRAKRLTIG